MAVYIKAHLSKVIKRGMDNSFSQMVDVIKDSGIKIFNMVVESFLILKLKIINL